MSTACRCVCPMASIRWCRCRLSALNGCRPSLVRRITASRKSSTGMKTTAKATISGASSAMVDRGPKGRRVQLAARADRRAGHGQSDEHRTGITHEDAGRREVVRQESDAGAEQGRGNQRRLGGGGVVPGEHQLPGGEDEQSERADRRHPGEKSVQAVDEVHRVGQHHGQQHRQHDALGLVQADQAAARTARCWAARAPATARRTAPSPRRPGSGRPIWRRRPGRTGRR